MGYQKNDTAGIRSAAADGGQRPKSSRRRLLQLIDVGCFIAAYLVNIVFVVLSKNFVQRNWLAFWPNFCILLAFLMLARFSLSVYRNVWRYPNVRAYFSMVAADGLGGVSALLITAVLNALGVANMYIGFWQTFFVVVLFDLSTLVLRFGYQLMHQHRNIRETQTKREHENGRKKANIAIVGAGQVGFHLAEELRANPTAHYTPACFIDCNKNKIGLRLADLDVYAEDDRILDVLSNLDVREVFIAIPNLPAEESQRMIKLYNDGGYPVKLYDFSARTTPDGHGSAVRPLIREFRYEDLLGRESLESRINPAELEDYYRDRVVLVTGGGGSIGSELCRQIAGLKPAHLIILDIYENNAYEIQQELRGYYGDTLKVTVEIASVRDEVRMEAIFKAYKPDVVFHAAAHKHVPLMEHSACEAIKNNVLGTYNTANMAEKYGVKKFVLISTDKAVNPTNVMGASKRLCEMVVQCRRGGQTAFTAVRFGNVLGSNGSVIPLFRSQIEKGGPVTITDKRIIRYFMTIPEASRLMMLAGSMAQDGELFVLDMGKQVRILDMAENMIRIMGYTPYKDIDIVEIGLRPGEKLYEELLIKTESLKKTANSLIFIEADQPLSRAEMEEKMDKLRTVLKETEYEVASPRIREVMKQLVPTFHDPEEVNRQAEKTREMQEAYGASAYTKV